MSKLQGLMFGLATVVLVALATYYFASRDWLPPLHSDRGEIDGAIRATLLVTGIVFIVTNLLLAFFAWRYQDEPGAKAAYWHDHPTLEWTWTLVTAAIMATFLFNALNLWAKIQSKPPADAMPIEVTAQQFAWNVRYPGKDGVFGRTDTSKASSENPIGLVKDDPAAMDDVMLLNNLILPKGRPVRVLIKSLDVVHSFFLPNFRVKQDAMPGLTTEIWFTARDTGDFEIACAQHCGLGHYKMRGMVKVVEPENFDKELAVAAAQ